MKRATLPSFMKFWCAVDGLCCAAAFENQLLFKDSCFYGLRFKKADGQKRNFDQRVNLPDIYFQFPDISFVNRIIFRLKTKDVQCILFKTIVV